MTIMWAAVTLCRIPNHMLQFVVCGGLCLINSAHACVCLMYKTLRLVVKYKRVWNSTLDKCVMQRDLQMGACARNCKLCPLFVFPFFVFSYNMLQHAHPAQWAMKYMYIYIYIILSWLIQLHSGLIAAIHLETKKACSFLASCMWCALMLQEVIPLISQNVTIMFIIKFQRSFGND